MNPQKLNVFSPIFSEPFGPLPNKANPPRRPRLVPLGQQAHGVPKSRANIPRGPAAMKKSTRNFS